MLRPIDVNCVRGCLVIRGEPSVCSTRQCVYPAATATRLLRPEGTVAGTHAGPLLMSPQATAVPSLLSAMLENIPAAIATTLLSPAGTIMASAPNPPQATT